MHPAPKRTADRLCARLATLLAIPVVVVDRHDIVVAGGSGVGLPLERSATRDAAPLRVPLHGIEDDWTLVISGTVESVVLAQALAEQLADDLSDPDAHPPTLPVVAELRDTFILELLQGTRAETDDALRIGQILGLRFEHPRAVILVDAAAFILRPQQIEAPDTAARLRQRAETVINTLLSHIAPAEHPVGAYLGAGEVALLLTRPAPADRPGDPPSPPRWADLAALKEQATALLRHLRYTMQSEASLGLGRYHPGVGGLACSYRDARTALTIGRRLRGPNQIYCLDTLGAAAFLGLTDEETKVDLARQLLAPLGADHDLLNTLRTFLQENASVAVASQRLMIHRNTLGYRLDKIATLTGLDPRRFEDAVQLQLALLLLRFN